MAATLAKPGSDETRPDLTVSFRLERGDQFLIGFQLTHLFQLNLFKIFTPSQNDGEIGKVLNRIFADSPNIVDESLVVVVLSATVEVLSPGVRRIELGR